MRTLWWRRRDCWAFWGWTEHSERSVLPTGLSLMEVPPQHKDLLGRWKPEGSDTYARTFAGRVARLQALFAKMARGADRYDRLDEREIAVPWLMERAKLSREQAELTVSGLRRRWKEGDLAVPDSVSDIPAEGPPLDDPAAGAGDADSSQASATEPEEPVCKQAKDGAKDDAAPAAAMELELSQALIEDGAKDDAAPAAATPPDQGSAMELELSQALIEVRRLTLFQGPALGEAIPRYFTEEQLRELMARLEDVQLYMRDLREENPAAATRASSPKGRAWLARGTSPHFTEEEVAAMSASMRSTN
eukprot:s9489_g2.t1